MGEAPIKISVSGRRFEILPQLIPIPGRLATLLDPISSPSERVSLADASSSGGSELFFARNAGVFSAVLDWVLDPRLGLHAPPGLCPARLGPELEFWGLADLACPCRPPSLAAVDDPLPSLDTSLPPSPQQSPSRDRPDPPACLMLAQRRALWKSIEEPHSSSVAGIFAILSISFVLISVSTLIIGSIPECQVPPDNEPHVSLVIIEYICVGWFSFEYLLRLATTPSYLKFCTAPLDVIDLISILPFYIELTLHIVGVTYKSIDNLKGALLVMRLLRVLRVARLFKLARYSAAMKSCGKTLKESRREVGMLVIFVGIMIVLFSTTVYFLEKDVEGTEFISVPATFWWCIITITTVIVYVEFAIR